MITEKKMLGTVELVMNMDPETCLSCSAIGLDKTSERWCVANDGKWCSQPVERANVETMTQDAS